MTTTEVRHRATADVWRWLESRQSHEMDNGRRERIARKLSELDADLHALDAVSTPKCTGYCVGTASAATLVEDLACPVHGLEAQEKAKSLYPDRQAWLDGLLNQSAQAA